MDNEGYSYFFQTNPKFICEIYKKDRVHPIHLNYIKQRIKLKRKAKITYYKNKTKQLKNDSKNLWKTIKEITGKSKKILDPNDYISIHCTKHYNQKKTYPMNFVIILI